MRSLRNFRLSPAALLALILIVQAGLGVARLSAVPLWTGHEADYTTVARFLANNGRLPTVADYDSPVEADLGQATQPPLVFFLYAPIVDAMDDAGALPPSRSPMGICLGQPADQAPLIYYAPTPAYDQPTRGIVGAGYALRGLNLLFGLLATLATYATGRALFASAPTTPSPTFAPDAAPSPTLPQRGRESGSRMRRVVPKGEGLGRGQGVIALAGAAIMAFLPQSVEIFTTISNDSLLILLSALHLWMLARFIRAPLFGGTRLRDGLFALGLALLAILTKLNGWALLVLTGLAFAVWIIALIVRAVRSREVDRRVLRVAIAGVALLIVGAVALGAFNLSQYGSVFGRYRELESVLARQIGNVAVPGVIWLNVADATQLSLLEPLDAVGARGAIRMGYIALIALGLLAAGVAMIAPVVGWVRSRRQQVTGQRAEEHGLASSRRGINPPANEPPVNPLKRVENRLITSAAAFVLLWASLALAFLLVLFRNAVNADLENTTAYSTAFIFAPLRYYAQALPAFALLLAGGVGVLAQVLLVRTTHNIVAGDDEQGSGRGRRVCAQTTRSYGVVAGVFVLVFVGVSVLWVAMLPRPTVETITLAQSNVLLASGRFRATDVAMIVANAPAPPVLNYVLNPDIERGLLTAEIVAQMPTNAAGQNLLGELTWGENRCQAIPARGVYPTTRWPSGELVQFTLTVPNCQADLPANAPVTLRWYGSTPVDDRTPAMLDAEPAYEVSLGSTTQPANVAASCPRVYGAFAGYKIVGYRAPDAVRHGETVVATVNWLVEAVSNPPPGNRAFRFTHSDGTGYECVGGEGSIHPTQWTRGETVYFDGCPFVFPPDAPTGDYAVSAALVDAAGVPIAGDFATLGTVRVE